MFKKNLVSDFHSKIIQDRSQSKTGFHFHLPQDWEARLLGRWALSGHEKVAMNALAGWPALAGSRKLFDCFQNGRSHLSWGLGYHRKMHILLVVSLMIPFSRVFVHCCTWMYWDLLIMIYIVDWDWLVAQWNHFESYCGIPQPLDPNTHRHLGFGAGRGPGLHMNIYIYIWK